MRFPSLRISKHVVSAVGLFAKRQQVFLKPDRALVAEVEGLMKRGDIGIVAHFYMDAELQGIINAVQSPNVSISDSLIMGDEALKQADRGVKNIAVMGVDFMTENVRAVLRRHGHSNVNVFRVAKEHIGCSLAESAEKMAYRAFLEKYRGHPKVANVIYINTSMAVKGVANSLVPTITCTSSNVVQTIRALRNVDPSMTILFGPDTYMGRNVESFFMHSGDPLDHFDYFKQGNCIVHHMFGERVVDLIDTEYTDCKIAAHFEVPGEMFELAMKRAKQSGPTHSMVGSTSQILKFITDSCQSEAASKIILGTESGMTTKIVGEIQRVIPEGHTVEIIFPVNDESVAITRNSDGLSVGVVPGPASGEGCSASGGCASCPYMKMNSIDNFIQLAETIVVGDEKQLQKYQLPSQLPSQLPRSGQRQTVGTTEEVIAGGIDTIQNMRDLQKTGAIGDAMLRKLGYIL